MENPELQLKNGSINDDLSSDENSVGYGMNPKDRQMKPTGLKDDIDSNSNSFQDGGSQSHLQNNHLMHPNPGHYSMENPRMTPENSSFVPDGGYSPYGPGYDGRGAVDGYIGQLDSDGNPINHGSQNRPKQMSGGRSYGNAIPNYPQPSPQRPMAISGQSIAQQGGPTPTLNQLLQSPNSQRNFPNSYADNGAVKGANDMQGSHYNNWGNRSFNPGYPEHAMFNPAYRQPGHMAPEGSGGKRFPYPGYPGPHQQSHYVSAPAQAPYVGGGMPAMRYPGPPGSASTQGPQHVRSPHYQMPPSPNPQNYPGQMGMSGYPSQQSQPPGKLGPGSKDDRDSREASSADEQSDNSNQAPVLQPADVGGQQPPSTTVTSPSSQTAYSPRASPFVSAAPTSVSNNQLPPSSRSNVQSPSNPNLRPGQPMSPAATGTQSHLPDVNMPPQQMSSNSMNQPNQAIPSTNQNQPMAGGGAGGHPGQRMSPMAAGNQRPGLQPGAPNEYGNMPHMAPPGVMYGKPYGGPMPAYSTQYNYPQRGSMMGYGQPNQMNPHGLPPGGYPADGTNSTPHLQPSQYRMPNHLSQQSYRYPQNIPSQYGQPQSAVLPPGSTHHGMGHTQAGYLNPMANSGGPPPTNVMNNTPPVGPGSGHKPGTPVGSAAPGQIPPSAQAAAQAAVMAAATQNQTNSTPPNAPNSPGMAGSGARPTFLKQHLQQRIQGHGYPGGQMMSGYPSNGPVPGMLPHGMHESMNSMPPPHSGNSTGLPQPPQVGTPSLQTPDGVEQRPERPESKQNMSGSDHQLIAPPPHDEASQQSTASSTTSTLDDRSETPRPRQLQQQQPMNMMPGHGPLSHPPTPMSSNMPSPGAASMSSYHDDFDSVGSPSWPRTPASPMNSHMVDGYHTKMPPHMGGYHQPMQPGMGWHGDSNMKQGYPKRPDGLSKLYEMSAEPERRAFLDQYCAFNEERGNPVTSCPTISKHPLDLFRLYVCVKERGGFMEVSRAKTWKDIAGIVVGASSTAAYTLRKQYVKHLLPFECKFDRGGIDPQPLIQQIEAQSKRKNKVNNSPSPVPNSQDGFGPQGDMYSNSNSQGGPYGSMPQQPMYGQSPPASEYHSQVMPGAGQAMHAPPTLHPGSLSPAILPPSGAAPPADGEPGRQDAPPAGQASQGTGESINLQNPFDDVSSAPRYQNRAGGIHTPPLNQAHYGGQFGQSRMGANTVYGPGQQYPPYGDQNATAGVVPPGTPSSVPPAPSGQDSFNGPQPNSAELPYRGAPAGNHESYTPNKAQSDVPYGAGGCPSANRPPVAPMGPHGHSQPPYGPAGYGQMPPQDYDRERYEQGPRPATAASHPGVQGGPPPVANPQAAPVTPNQPGAEFPPSRYPAPQHGPPPTGSQSTQPNSYPHQQSGGYYSNHGFQTRPPYQGGYGGQPYAQNEPQPPYQNWVPPTSQSNFNGSTTPQGPTKSGAPAAPFAPPPGAVNIGPPKRHPDFMKPGMDQPNGPYPSPASSNSTYPAQPYGSWTNNQPPHTSYSDGTQGVQPNPPMPSGGSLGDPHWQPPGSAQPPTQRPGFPSNIPGSPAYGQQMANQQGPSVGNQILGPSPSPLNRMMSPRMASANFKDMRPHGPGYPGQPRIPGPHGQPMMTGQPGPYGGAPLKREITFPPDSIESASPVMSKRRRLVSKDVSPVEAWRLLMALKSGLLCETTWALDVLTVLLYDDSTVLYFNLANMPGLLEALLEHFRQCLVEIFVDEMDFGQSLGYAHKKDKSSSPDRKWFETGLRSCTEDSDLGGVKAVDISPADRDVILNGKDYTYMSRNNKAVRLVYKTDVFVTDEERDWDCYDRFESGSQHWQLGRGDLTAHVLTKFENPVRFVPFTSVLGRESDICDLNSKTKLLKSEGGDSAAQPEGAERKRCFNEYEDEAYQRDEASLYLTSEAQESTANMCLAISNILRSLSFVPGNDVELCKHAGFLLAMGKLLLLHHEHPLRKELQRNYDKDDDVDFTDSCTSLQGDKDWWWDTLSCLRENTLVTIANIAGQLDLSLYPEQISLPLFDGLLHWAVCPSATAQDPLPTLPPHSTLSPQRLSLEAITKLAVNESNVDLLLATPPFSRMEKFFSLLSKWLGRGEDQVVREFSVAVLSFLSQADSGSARAIALAGPCISLLLAFVEQAEQSAVTVANMHGVGMLRENPDCMGTSLDMLRRAASTLLSLAKIQDNRPLFMQHQQRLLSLVISQIMDQHVAGIIADILYECSLPTASTSPSKYAASRTVADSQSSSGDSCSNSSDRLEAKQEVKTETLSSKPDGKGQLTVVKKEDSESENVPVLEECVEKQT